MPSLGVPELACLLLVAAAIVLAVVGLTALVQRVQKRSPAEADAEAPSQRVHRGLWVALVSVLVLAGVVLVCIAATVLPNIRGLSRQRRDGVKVAEVVCQDVGLIGRTVRVRCRLENTTSRAKAVKVRAELEATGKKLESTARLVALDARQSTWESFDFAEASHGDGDMECRCWLAP